MNYTKWIMAEFLINGISWDQQFDCVCCWTQWYDHPIKVQKHPRTKCVASFCPTNPNRMEESQTLTSWLKCFKGNWCHVPCQQTQTTTNYIICQNHIQLWLEDLWHLFSGWWVFKPSEKYSSNWIISPQVGMKKKHQLLKPPPRFKIRPELLSVPGSPSPWMTHQGTEIFTTKPCRSTTTSARCNEAWQVPRLNLDDWTNHQWLPWRNFVVFLVGVFKEQKRT